MVDIVWLTYREAAERLGMTLDSVRVKARRSKWTITTGNDGRHRVAVPVRLLDSALERSGASALERSIPSAPEQSDLVAELRRQLEQVEARHDAEVRRLVDQVGRERELWLERIDVAELRAERVEQRLDQVLDVLLTERRPWWSRWLGVTTKSDLSR